MDPAATWAELNDVCSGIALSNPALAAGLRGTVPGTTPERGLARLLGRVLQPVWLSAVDVIFVAEAEFIGAPERVVLAVEDLAAITSRNLESGGVAWTWLGSRGFHVLVPHRVIHLLWRQGELSTALAFKAGLVPLGADIHPALRFDCRILLDHGVGLVIGETAIIGGGATLGNIAVGEGAIVAVGGLVLQPVPLFTVVVGNPAVAKSGYRHSFGYTLKPSSEVQR